MDPNANLAEQLKLAQRIYANLERPIPADIADDAARLCELVEALDEWIRRGGFLPGSWQRGRKGV